MQTNEIPAFDASDNPTGCCPRFHPERWDGVTLHFDHKPFVKASTVSFFHMPLNMGHVMTKTWAAIEKAHAATGAFLVLSRDTSAWHAEHLFAVDAAVPGADMVELSGDYFCKVFEGPFQDAPRWCEALQQAVEDVGKTAGEQYLYYTTCPKCAAFYGKNYVVGVARLG